MLLIQLKTALAIFLNSCLWQIVAELSTCINESSTTEVVGAHMTEELRTMWMLAACSFLGRALVTSCPVLIPVSFIYCKGFFARRKLLLQEVEFLWVQWEKVNESEWHERATCGVDDSNH